MLSKNGNTAVRRERERDARGALQRPVTDPSQHEKFSPGARPDVAVKRGAQDGLHWLLLEVKVATPIATGKTGQRRDPPHVVPLESPRRNASYELLNSTYGQV